MSTVNLPELPAEAVAVVGMSGRFPMASSVDELWSNLVQERNAITFFSSEPQPSTAVPSERQTNTRFVRAWGVIQGAREFDAEFFGINPRDAALTDPQHRLLLECAWEALENAGYTPSKYRGRIGVYVGTSPSLYSEIVRSHRSFAADDVLQQVEIGSAPDFAATRISHKLDLTGPSIAVQTACSTSLVGVHLACQSLLTGECDMALAGGANVDPSPITGYNYREGGVMSPDGYCRAFADNAAGFVGGEGAGVVVLKRLSEALAHQDHIYSVILGSAVNNDGADKAGFTAPSSKQQASVITDAMAASGLGASDISYVEAHGSGTPLGDAIELAALAQAFKSRRADAQKCALGSIKSNVGHLGAAAGITGFIKASLALYHGILPASLHCDQPTTKFGFSQSPFELVTKTRTWPVGELPRRAGVSSFGIGGTNAHVILEEPPRIAPVKSLTSEQGDSRSELLPLSAKSPTTLAEMHRRLAAYMSCHPNLALRDLAWTLQSGRTEFPFRSIIECSSMADGVSRLMSSGDAATPDLLPSISQPSVGYLFAGKGELRERFARLYAMTAAFRSCVDECLGFLQDSLGVEAGRAVATRMLHAVGLSAERSSNRDSAESNDAALFIVQYALAKQWAEWGVTPGAVCGYGVGAIVAGCVAGVLSASDAVHLAAVRARARADLPRGKMLAVAASERTIREVIEVGGGIALGAWSLTDRCVLVASENTLREMQRRFTQSDVRTRLFAARHACDAVSVARVRLQLVDELRKIPLAAPSVPILSSTSGAWLSLAQALDAEWWAECLSGMPRIDLCAETLFADKERLLLEVGSGNEFTTVVQRHSSGFRRVMPKAHLDPTEFAGTRHAAADLWIRGVELDWEALRGRATPLPSRIPLPTYPFRRREHVIKHQETGDVPPVASSAEEARVEPWLYTPSWKRASTLRLGKPSSLTTKDVTLVLTDDAVFGEAIASQIQAVGASVIVGLAGTALSIASNRIELDMSRPDHYASMLSYLEGAGSLPTKIVHFLTLPEDAGNAVDKRDALTRRSLLNVVRALDDYASLSCELIVLTTGACEVTGAEELAPEEAALHGLCKVLGQEFANVTVRVVDVDRHERDEVMQLADGVVMELQSPEPPGGTVAHRSGYRWLQIFERTDEVQSTPQGPSPAYGDAVTLITGGLGWIALDLAEVLAVRGARRIALIARRPFPQREHWEELLTSLPKGDRLAERIRRVVRIEGTGASVLILTADVADEKAMAAAFRRVRTQWGGIDCVIHGAGIVSPDAFTEVRNVTDDEFRRHAQPKMGGAHVLLGLTATYSVRSCVLLSSLSPFLGGAGFAAYAAANAGMDCYAFLANRKRGTRWLTVNMEAWETPGHATTGPTPEPQLKARDGGELFIRAIASEDNSQVVISMSDLASRIARWISAPGGPRSRAADATRSEGLREQPDDAPRTEVEAMVAAVWAELLGLPFVGIHEDFLQLGGHSLLQIQILARLRRELHVDLPRDAVFHSPTVATLSAAITDQLMARAF